MAEFGADDQDESEDHNRGEVGILAQLAQAEAQILGEALDKIDAAGVAAFFLRPLDSAELNARTPQRFLARYATAHQILAARLDVKAHLRIDLADRKSTRL